MNIVNDIVRAFVRALAWRATARLSPQGALLWLAVIVVLWFLIKK